MSDHTVVSLRGVSFAYNGVSVLDHVDLTIQAYEFVAIVGPNGGGKTTLLKLILGLLHPSSGEVRVFGESPVRTRRRIGYMPQHVHHDPQFPVTVMDIVLMGRLGRSLRGSYSKEDKRAALAALDELGLADIAGALFAELSGGQRQRVLIARALACDPALLLLDEPMANVDALAEARLLDDLQELNRRMTILMVSHDLGFVSNVVKSVVCVNRRVVVHSTSEITGETIRDIYAGDVRMVRHDHRCSEQGHTCG